jgi:hypothetical protein
MGEPQIAMNTGRRPGMRYLPEDLERPARPVGTNMSGSSTNAPTGIGKLGLPSELSSGVTPRLGG